MFELIISWGGKKAKKFNQKIILTFPAFFDYLVRVKRVWDKNLMRTYM